MHSTRTLSLASLLVLLVISVGRSADRPNVVIIITDDQGIGDFGVAGNAVMETPNIDRLAKQSASMSTFYVSPVCSPTRACLMTGRYNYRTRCIDTYLGRSMMDPDEVTIAERLADVGYATGIFGKWHLGDCYPMRAIDQGFEEALVHRGGGLAQPSEPPENDRRYTDPILFHNGEQVQTKGFCTDVYFGAALRFIEQSQKVGRHFFVYLPTNAPHGPYHDVPAALYERYMAKDLASIVTRSLQGKPLENETDRLARIAAMITNIDQNVGRLLTKLDELNLTKNTLVMFMVDNGPNSRRFVGPHRGKKSDVHEGGIRSPLWLHWPSRLEPRSHPELSAHIDLLPTILDACQVEIPTEPSLDGRSLLPILDGRPVDWPERTVVIQSHRGNAPRRYHHFMIRRGPWKLLHASGFQRETFEGAPAFELYNVVKDPGEQQNLLATEPEVFAGLRRDYDLWFDDVGRTRPDNYAPPRIHLGTPHENPTVLTRQDWRNGTWQRNAVGYWVVHVARGGHFDVQLLFDTEPVNEVAELHVGSLSNKQQVKPGDRSVLFHDLELPAGDTTLAGILLNGDRKRGIYQAVVRRLN